MTSQNLAPGAPEYSAVFIELFLPTRKKKHLQTADTGCARKYAVCTGHRPCPAQIVVFGLEISAEFHGVSGDLDNIPACRGLPWGSRGKKKIRGGAPREKVHTD